MHFGKKKRTFWKKNKVYTWIGIQPRCYNHITLELCKMVTYGQLQKMQYIQWSKKDFEKNFSSLVTLWTSNFYRKFIFESINDDDPSIIFSRNNTQQPLRIEKKKSCGKNFHLWTNITIYLSAQIMRLSDFTKINEPVLVSITIENLIWCLFSQ